MTQIISGENAVQVQAHSCIISPSNEGYTLCYSGDGISWTEYDESVPAYENLIINGLAWGTYIMLQGNQTDVTINW